MNKKMRAVLTSLSCLGVIGVGAVAVNDTLKHSETELSFKNYIKKNYKDYIPTAIVGTATITSILTNHILSTKDIKSIGLLAASTTALLADYKESIKDEFGEEGLNKVVQNVANKRIQRAKTQSIYHDGFTKVIQDIHEDGDTLFYDEFTDTWFVSSLFNVKDAMYHFNRNFQLHGGEIAMDEFYDFLGITPEMQWPKGLYGYGFGLLEDGINWIDFELCPCETETGEGYYAIYLTWQPGEFNEYEGSYYVET